MTIEKLDQDIEAQKEMIKNLRVFETIRFYQIGSGCYVAIRDMISNLEDRCRLIDDVCADDIKYISKEEPIRVVDTSENIKDTITLVSWEAIKGYIGRGLKETISEELTVTEFIELTDEDKLNYLIEKVDQMNLLLQKEVEVIEEEIDSLDGVVYISPIQKKGDKMLPPLIKVGTVDESRVVKFFPIETNAPIVPNLYKSDFYYVSIDMDRNSINGGLNSVEPSAMYKKFTPKNKINQILITKEDVTYTTGYIDSNGVAIYYDQLPKHYYRNIK